MNLNNGESQAIVYRRCSLSRILSHNLKTSKFLLTHIFFDDLIIILKFELCTILGYFIGKTKLYRSYLVVFEDAGPFRHEKCKLKAYIKEKSWSKRK